MKKSTFGYWNRKLSQEKKNKELVEVKFIPVKETDIEIRVQDKYKIRVTKFYDEQLLLRVLKTLEFVK